MIFIKYRNKNVQFKQNSWKIFKEEKNSWKIFKEERPNYLICIGFIDKQGKQYNVSWCDHPMKYVFSTLDRAIKFVINF